MATTIQDNVNNYYFKTLADFEANKAEIPNNATVYIEETGEVNVEINGTETEAVENLTNIVVGSTTYKVPTQTIDTELSETSENAVQNKVITTDISGVKSRVTDLENDNETNKTSISTLTTNMTNAQSEISALNNSVSTMAGNQTTDEANISTNTSNIATNTTDISSINTILAKYSFEDYTIGGGGNGD